MNDLERRFMAMVSGEPCKGWIYYIACAETARIKIGYTSGCVEKRLKALQTGSAGELIIIAVHPGDPADELFLHDWFEKHRVRGEWFKMAEELFEHICLVTWMAARAHLILGYPLEDWVRRGLTVMEDFSGELPEDLAALKA